ncbi:MAG: ribbon-helix-helix protein, CopG family [Janthinobacterium lividum]
MSRILIDLPDTQLAALSALVESERRPRAAVIRDAIEAYISRHKPGSNDGVFGLRKNRRVDGLEYQQELRSEW